MGGNKLRTIGYSCIVWLFASSGIATTIPADALINFQVNGWAPVGNGPYSTHVAAWQNTGLFLNEGDQFALTATGIASVSPAHAANGGSTPDGDGGNVDIGLAPTARLPGSRYALVGKIGTELEGEFLVGSSFSGVANDTGFLYLGFNDTHYFDNSGFFTVSTASAVPESSSLLLLATGLLGLAVHGGRGRYLTGEGA